MHSAIVSLCFIFKHDLIGYVILYQEVISLLHLPWATLKGSTVIEKEDHFINLPDLLF